MTLLIKIQPMNKNNRRGIISFRKEINESLVSYLNKKRSEIYKNNTLSMNIQKNKSVVLHNPVCRTYKSRLNTYLILEYEKIETKTTKRSILSLFK